MASYEADKYWILHQKWPAIHLWNRDDLRVDHRDLVCGIGNWESGIGSWSHWSLTPPRPQRYVCATLPLLHTAQLAVAGIAFNKFLLEAISSNTGPDTLLASYLHTPRQEWTWLISQGFSHLWFLNWSKSQMNGCHAQSESYCSQHLFLAPSLHSLSGELLLVETFLPNISEAKLLPGGGSSSSF